MTTSNKSTICSYLNWTRRSSLADWLRTSNNFWDQNNNNINHSRASCPTSPHQPSAIPPHSVIQPLGWWCRHSQPSPHKGCSLVASLLPCWWTASQPCTCQWLSRSNHQPTISGLQTGTHSVLSEWPWRAQQLHTARESDHELVELQCKPPWQFLPGSRRSPLSTLIRQSRPHPNCSRVIKN